MVSTPSPPAPPDPVTTANAQTASNKETATTQQQLNMVNQVAPQGTLTYQQSGTWADGTPKYTATTAYSPEQQNLYNLGVQTQTNLGEIGRDQSSKVAGILNTPFDLNSAINTQQSDIATKLLDPVWNQRESALEQKLATQGIQQGSQAYTNALQDFGMQRDQAYNSALLQGRAQAEQEALANRNQPLNEISALMSGSQVSQPSFGNTPSTSVQPTDVIGAYNNAYQGQLAAYNSQVGAQNAMWGGLGALGGAALGGWGMGGFKKFW